MYWIYVDFLYFSFLKDYEVFCEIFSFLIEFSELKK